MPLPKQTKNVEEKCKLFTFLSFLLKKAQFFISFYFYLNFYLFDKDHDSELPVLPATWSIYP